MISPIDTSSSYTCDVIFLAPMLAPFLFPFVMEYSLLAVATMYSMYADVGVHATKSSHVPKSRKDIKSRKEDKNRGDEQADMSINVQFTEINFHKSHRGLFLGLLLLAGVGISTVLYFVYIESDSTSNDDAYMSQVTNSKH